MPPQNPQIDEAYRAYALLLHHHHHLLATGREAAAETEDVEEELSRGLDGLDDAQRRSLSGLASDLNWVRRACVPPPKGPKREEVTAGELQKLEKAEAASDWHGLLHQLRVCAPRVPPFRLAQLRAVVWNALSFPVLASTFYNVAAGLEPNEPVG